MLNEESAVLGIVVGIFYIPVDTPTLIDASQGHIGPVDSLKPLRRDGSRQRSVWIPVRGSSTDCGGATPNDNERLINKIRNDSYKPWNRDECFDVFTHYAALECLRTRRPRVLYIGDGETDEWAHAGNDKAYLEAAHQADQWIQELWQFVQNDPHDKEKTTLFVTVDRGRGDRQKDRRTGHGQ